MEGLTDHGNDELRIYRGKDYFIKEGISIHQPTLGEICDYGEEQYYAMISTLTSSPADFNWQLDEMGIDYTKISDYELFYSLLYQGYSTEQTKIIFGDLDFSAFELYEKKETHSPVLYNSVQNITIDEYTYLLIVEILRKIHGLARNAKMPGNEATKKILIADAKEQYLINKDKEYHSQLKNLISTMINSEGFKYNHDEVWNMKIHAFMDSVKRLRKIKNADLLLQSGYSGFGIDLKSINKNELNYMGALE